MDKAELLEKLKECDLMDTEKGHVKADNLLLEYIDDEDIKEAYEAIDKWYA